MSDHETEKKDKKTTVIAQNVVVGNQTIVSQSVEIDLGPAHQWRLLTARERQLIKDSFADLEKKVEAQNELT